MTKDSAYSSPYNYVYSYLLKNYEPSNDISKELLLSVYKKFCAGRYIQCSDEQAVHDINRAIKNFRLNNGSKGATVDNLGKPRNSSLDTVKEAVADLKW